MQNLTKTVDDQTIEKIKNYYSRRLGEDYILPVIGFYDKKNFPILKNVLKTLEERLQFEEYYILGIALSSMFLNKTRYITSYLSHNISLEEIFKIEEYGNKIEALSSLRNNLSIFPKKSKPSAGSITYTTSEQAIFNSFRLADMIGEFDIPIILYACGFQDLIEELHLDFSELKKAYLERNLTSQYDYAYSKCNQEVIKKVIEAHRSNFEALLSLNEQSDIYALSAFLPSKMDRVYEKPFRDLILRYNTALLDLCREYQVSYINSRGLEKMRFNGPSCYENQKSVSAITNEILKVMAKRVEEEKENLDLDFSPFRVDDMGSFGVFCDLYQEMIQNAYLAARTVDYEQEVYLERFQKDRKELEGISLAYRKVKKKSFCN